MVLWQGLTEGGTAVPVQVTEAGKVVAEGQEGKEGPPGPPGSPGPPGPQGEYGPGDDVDLGSITAAGLITAGGPNEGSYIYPNGYISLQTDETFPFLTGYNKSGSDILINLDNGGSITAAGSIQAAGNIDSNDVSTAGGGAQLSSNGGVWIRPADSRNDTATALEIYKNGSSGANATITLQKGGAGIFAGNKAGFTADGELYFTSRGIRYKIFVSQGLVQAEEYTREMQLREQVEDKRKPRPTDSVPGD